MIFIVFFSLSEEAPIKLWTRVGMEEPHLFGIATGTQLPLHWNGILESFKHLACQELLMSAPWLCMVTRIGSCCWWFIILFVSWPSGLFGLCLHKNNSYTQKILIIPQIMSRFGLNPFFCFAVSIDGPFQPLFWIIKSFIYPPVKKKHTHTHRVYTDAEQIWTSKCDAYINYNGRVCHPCIKIECLMVPIPRHKCI